MKEIKPKVFKDFLFNLKSIDKVIELGSHTGWLTNQISNKVSNVITYEADTHNYKELIKNINHNVTAFNIGVTSTEQDSTIPLYYATGKQYKNESEVSQYHSTIKRKFWNGSHTTINTTNFLNILNKQYNVLVMDIEGSERDILKKYSAEIIDNFSTLCFEYHPDVSKNVNTLLGIYDLYVNKYKYCYTTGSILYLKSRRHVRLWNNSIILLFTNTEIPNKSTFNMRQKMLKFIEIDDIVISNHPNY